MEFKDKLKNLRKEKGISQQALADAIFVSRSAVAKWENGLGLPSEESYEALMNYFELSKDEFSTEEPEAIIIEKNKSIHKLKIVLSIIASVVLLFFTVVSILILNGSFGFTSKMAAGKSFANDRCIYTADYDIYYYTFNEGTELEVIAGFCPVKKVPLGYMVFEEDYEYEEVYCNGERVGIIYSFEGDDCCYNIFRYNLVEDIPPYLASFNSVNVDGVNCPVIYNSYFVTEDTISEFMIGDMALTIGQ